MTLPSNGFQIKTYEEILQSMKTRLQTNLNTDLDIGEETNLGKLAAIYAAELSDAYIFNAGIADSDNLDNATGKALDDTGSLTANLRGTGSPSNGKVQLTSLFPFGGYTIPAGTLFSSPDTSLEYVLDSDTQVTNLECISTKLKIPAAADNGVYGFTIDGVLFFSLSERENPPPEYMLQILSNKINGDNKTGDGWAQITMSYSGTPYTIPAGTFFSGGIEGNIYELGNIGEVDNTNCTSVKTNLTSAVLDVQYKLIVNGNDYPVTISSGPISPLIVLETLATDISSGEPNVTATVVSNNDMIVALDDQDTVFSVTAEGFDLTFTEVTSRGDIGCLNNTSAAIPAGSITKVDDVLPNFISVTNVSALTVTPTVGSAVATSSLPSNSEILVTSNSSIVNIELDTPNLDIFPITEVTSLGSISGTTNNADEVPAGSITTILTPVENLISVNNEDALATGFAPETDLFYRKSLKDSTSIIGGATVSALQSKLNNLPDVSYAVVRENDEDLTDPEGLPPFSLRATVEGGDAQVIGQLIWDFKTVGTSSEGALTVSVTDAQGLPKDVNFDRPVGVPIVLNVDATLDPERGAPTEDLEEVVRDLIVAYGGLTYTIGRDVISYELFGPVYSGTSGYTFPSITITSPVPSASGVVSIASNERATFDSVDITVTII